MEMGKAGDAHAKLARMAGDWTGEEVMSPSMWDPAGGTAVGRVSNRTAIDGLVLVQDYEQERDGKISFRGHGVFSYDAGEEIYVLHWWDSMGIPPNVFKGYFEGDVLTMTSSGAMGHSRTVFEFVGDDGYKFRMEMSMDGSQWGTLMQGSYKRG